MCAKIAVDRLFDSAFFRHFIDGFLDFAKFDVTFFKIRKIIVARNGEIGNARLRIYEKVFEFYLLDSRLAVLFYAVDFYLLSLSPNAMLLKTFKWGNSAYF